MTDKYNLIFRGDIVPGHALADVKDKLGSLFKVPPEKVEALFSGRPMVIKKNTDAATAEKLRLALENIGAIAEVRALAPEASVAEESADEAPAADTSEADKGSGPFTVEPPGADVLKPEERPQVPAVEVSIDHLSVDDPGADVLKPGERRQVEAPEIDISHLSVKPLDDDSP